MAMETKSESKGFPIWLIISNGIIIGMWIMWIVVMLIGKSTPDGLLVPWW